MSETDIQRSILEALHLRGVFCWRVNSGATLIKGAGAKKRLVIGAPAGTPDIIGAVPGTGVMFGIEVKTPVGKLSASQLAWRTRAGKYGIRYGVARSAVDALALIEQWRLPSCA